jgi:hypothetical protein
MKLITEYMVAVKSKDYKNAKKLKQELDTMTHKKMKDHNITIEVLVSVIGLIRKGKNRLAISALEGLIKNLQKVRN